MTYMMGPKLRQWAVKTMGWKTWTEFESLTYPDFMTGYLNPGGPYYQTENWANCRPGTKFVYSTPGFDLLGYLVEQVSGQPFNDYLHDNIYVPLRMTNTTATPLDNPEQIAIPYERFYGVLGKTNIQLPFSQRWRIGGGSLYSTVTDLAHFLTAHMNQGEFEGYKLLQPESLALMHKKTETSGGDFLQIGYGYGWGIYRKESWQMWDITFEPRGYQGHGGTYWGYSSAMFMVQEEEGTYGYVLLMNTGHVGKADSPWDIAIKLNIGNAILQESHRLYLDSLDQ
jgi:CubicO group peptidase (beta-lactamase class C family)